MEDRRKYQRSQTERNGKYSLDGKEEGFGECTITDVSREGMRIRFNTGEKINIGSSIHLEVSVSPEAKLVNVKGILKWINQKEIDLTGGIKITELRSKDTAKRADVSKLHLVPTFNNG
ncbi:MAG: PilZ domain-containing protein [Deltaproteobacteria bacterium]|jgi:PilZ domain|nr:PilZ domain-containing protein [Deltaproteobacteria bacterium]